MITEKLLENVLEESINAFRSYKNLAEKAITQVSDDEFFKLIDEESNSIALIVKHVGGNLRSRWTDFLTSDGEKPNRFRDTEFIETEEDTREKLLNSWEAGWKALFTTLEALTPADFEKTVMIRTEKFTVFKALGRSLTHIVYHVGQITFLAKHLRSKTGKH